MTKEVDRETREKHEKGFDDQAFFQNFRDRQERMPQEDSCMCAVQLRWKLL